MEIPYDDAVQMVNQHNIETNVKETISWKSSPIDVLAFAYNGLVTNPDDFNVSISHPFILFDHFVNHMKTYEYYMQNMKEWNDRGLFCVWTPCINDLSFFRSKKQMIDYLDHKMDDGKSFWSLTTFNIKHIDLYTKGFKISYVNGETYYGLFDTIKK